jgi:hypothetical protein
MLSNESTVSTKSNVMKKWLNRGNQMNYLPKEAKVVLDTYFKLLNSKLPNFLEVILLRW